MNYNGGAKKGKGLSSPGGKGKEDVNRQRDQNTWPINACKLH